MKRALTAFAISIFFAVAAYADDSVKDFSFKSVDGKTVEYKAGDGSVMVVSVGSHW